MKRPSQQKALENFGFGTQIRRSPFFEATVRDGATGFSVYNHMYIPRDFGDPEKNFWNLISKARLSDVSVQRQVEITGKDAYAFTQLLTPRNFSNLSIGQCKYVLITDELGGILNDPVLIRLEEDCFWLSIADSDFLLWAKGVAINSGYEVKITEPDVSPLQLQGPRSGEIVYKLFGDRARKLNYYWHDHFYLEDMSLVVSRTGWSNELGYEIFLKDSKRGSDLWEAIMRAGQEFGLKPGHTSTIRRVEAGMLSYHADMDSTTNPFELGLDRLVDLEMQAKFIGKDALRKTKSQGVERKQIGIEIVGGPLVGPNTQIWMLCADGVEVGKITSAIYSPRLKKNIALGMVSVEFSTLGTELKIVTEAGVRSGVVVQKPFFDQQKQIPNQSKGVTGDVFSLDKTVDYTIL